MRVILNFFLLIMVLVIGLAAYSILNTYVSIKYEIEPLRKTSAEIQEKAELHQSLISSYWIIICLGILVVVLTLDKLKKGK